MGHRAFSVPIFVPATDGHRRTRMAPDSERDGGIHLNADCAGLEGAISPHRDAWSTYRFAAAKLVGTVRH
jgi:hypothetical protein